MDATKRLVSDIICFLSVSLPLLLIHLYGQPFERGFFCNDNTIMYPFKPSTVSVPLLVSLGFGIPTFVMLISEALCKSFKSGDEPHFVLSWRVPDYLVRIYKVVGIFFFGVSCAVLLTGIGKITTGRLRPHFMEVCNPDVDCKNPINKFRYIENFVCQEKDEMLVREARFSFPSGHASFLSFTMVYLTIYIQKRLVWSGRYIVKGALQLSCIAVCWFTALSRISDHHHHSTDVFVGLLIGISAAIMSASYMTSLLRNKTLPLKQGWELNNPSGLWKIHNWFRDK